MTQARSVALPRPVRRWVLGWAILAALVTTTVAVWHSRNGEPAPSVEMAAVLWLVTVLTIVVMVNIDAGAGIREAFSLTEISAVLLVVLLPPHWAIAVAATAVPLGQLILTRGVLHKMVFNVSWHLTGISLAAALFYAISGPDFQPRSADLIAAVLAGCLFVFVNSMAFVGLLANAGDRSWRSLASEDLRMRVPLELGMALTGLLTAVLFVAAPVALPLLAVPVVLDYLRSRSRRNTVALEVAQRQAEAASRAKSEFLSQMSHELRTPLNAILGFGQLLELADLDAEDAAAVAQILAAGHHLLALIEDVLDVSRIEMGRMDLAPEPVHVGDLIAATMPLVIPMAEERAIRVEVVPLECDETVMADRRRAAQALLNLLSNAVKYNNEGGEITVLCSSLEGSVQIAVRDNGPGIPKDQQVHLFEPFERLGAERTGVEGTGLGLSLTRLLVDQMGGEIGFNSAPGAGSTFWFSLPRAD